MFKGGIMAAVPTVNSPFFKIRSITGELEDAVMVPVPVAQAYKMLNDSINTSIKLIFFILILLYLKIGMQNKWNERQKRNSFCHQIESVNFVIHSRGCNNVL
jgi:hypothetical protein